MKKETSPQPIAPIIPKPMLHITSKDLPAIKEWKIGETYTLEIKAKQVSLSQYGDEPYSASFEIKDVKAIGPSSKHEELKQRYS